MSFKFNARTVFLTFPQCSLSKEEVLQGLQQVADIQDYIVSLEAHKDGTPHVHAVVRFASRFHTTNSRAFDLQNFHPNIKTLKTQSDFKRVAKYVKKDGDYLTNISESLSPNQQLAADLLAYGLTREVVLNHPQLIFKNFNSIRSWVNYMRPLSPLPLATHKKRHIWLYGPSNTGKTTWLTALRSAFETAEIPVNNDFSHVQPNVEILFSDEYRGFMTIQSLNKVCDGNTIVNTKGGSLNLPAVTVVIISNFSIEECYPNVNSNLLITVHNRFNSFDSSYKLPQFPKFIIKK